MSLAPWLGLLVFLGAFAAEARVFNIKQEQFAAYVRGTYYPTGFENTAFSESNGANITVTEEFSYNLSGEFGFTYSSSIGKLRFGFEVIRPPTIKDTAKNGASVDMYDISSEAAVYVPKITWELGLKEWNTTRVFLNLGAGMATLTARNAYDFTTAGSAALTAADYSEDLRGSAIMYDGTLGLETRMFDTTTLVLEGGYRMLNFTEIKHNKDNTLMGGTTVTKGDIAKNADGTDRELDLSGMYLSLMFRFWIY